MAEGVVELVGSAFHLREDTFDAIAIPMGFMLESEPKPVECSVKLRSLIDQKHGIVDVMFLAEFLQEFHGD